MKPKKLKKKLKKIMGRKKYYHSLRVADTAVMLAAHHDVNIKKCEIAALLHDVGYYLDTTRENRGLRHAELSYRYAKDELKIKDKKILNAIRYHTIGLSKLTRIGKIVFLADKIEPNRKYAGVDQIRELALVDIDAAICLTLESTIKYLGKKNQKVHPATLTFYKSLKNKEENIE